MKQITIRIAGQFVKELNFGSKYENMRPECSVELILDHEPTDDDYEGLRKVMEKVLSEAESVILESYFDLERSLQEIRAELKK